MKAAQFSLRAIFVAVTVVAAVLGLLLALARGIQNAERQALVGAARDGRIGLEEVRERIGEDEYQRLLVERAGQNYQAQSAAANRNR